MSKPHTWKVNAEESGVKLIAYIKAKMGDAHSARQIKRAIEDNLCTVNGRTERHASTTLGKGDVVAFSLGEAAPQRPKLAPRECRTHILFEDEHLFVYNKPAGVASDCADFLSKVRAHCPTAILVHRLDRDTTGALIFAKSRAIFEAFRELFHSYQVHKVYDAIVDGIPLKNRGSLENFLGQLHTYQGQALWGEVDKQHGKYAHTAWQIEKKGQAAAWLRCSPKTGRTHQLRVHLNGMGHPILGDYQYGRTFGCTYKPARYLLHAAELTFPHPITGQKIHVQAPLPEDFKQALAAIF